MYPNKIILLLFFLILGSKIIAQKLSVNTPYTVTINHFSVKEGLSDEKVNTIFQDRQGINWIATDDGLNRFDGYSFERFLGKRHGVDLRRISRIGQDDEGWLWLRNHGALFFMHPESEEFITIEERFGKGNILSSLVTYIPETLENFPNDSIGRIYFETETPYHLYTYHSTEGVRKLRLPEDIDFLEYELLTVRKDGTILLRERCFNLPYHLHICPKLVLKINDKTEAYEVVEIYYTDFNGQSISNKDSIETDETDYPQLQRFNPTNGSVWNVSFDPWSIDVYDETGKEIVQLNPITLPRYYFGDLLNIFFDSQDRAWLATKSGFSIVHIHKNQFEFIESTPFSDGSEASAEQFIIEKDKLTVGYSRKGVKDYDYATETWKEWDLSLESERRIVSKRKDGGYWLGFNKELYLYMDDSLSVFPIFEQFPDYEDIYISVIQPAVSDDSQLWIGTKYGLFALNTHTMELRQIPSSAAITMYSVQYIVPDDDNTLWLCSPQGLLFFDGKEVTTVYNMDQEEAYFLPAMNFMQLLKDEAGIYWIGTASEGLIRWDKKNETYLQLNNLTEFPTKVIHAMAFDDFNNLWMSSPEGMIRLNKTTLASKLYAFNDFKLVQSANAKFREESGRQRLFFGGFQGIINFYPDSFQPNKKSVLPKLVVLSYKRFNGKERLISDENPILNKDKIIIKPKNHIAEFKVGLLSYLDADKNQYEYRLDIRGKKSVWHTQLSQYIDLQQLPYGKHDLYIRAKTFQGVPSANELYYSIWVIRPFYLRWWFVISIFFILIVGFYQWLKFRTLQYTKRQKELEEIVVSRTAKIEEDKKVIEQQAEELRTLDRLKSRFFANVSHELRTPLTLIMAPISNTLERNRLDIKDHTNLEMAKRSGQQLKKKIDEILDLTKLESGKLELFLTKVNWYIFLKTLVANFESLADIKNIEYQFEYEGNDALLVKIDSAKMEIIINNLLSNAFKFTPNNGRISVLAKETGSSLHLSVKDTGRGIYKDDIPYIFDRFYSTKNENTIAEGGTGIGLTLTKELLALMKGDIEVDSEWGVGTTFSFSVPKVQLIGQVSTEDVLEIKGYESVKNTLSTTQKLPSIQSHQATILLIEDNIDLRFFVKSLLEEKYNVWTAENGQDALVQLNTINSQKDKQLPSLIISDIMMPIMDGYQLLEVLKSDAIYRTIPIIMLTARAAMRDKLKALRIGVDDYLTKPFDREELFIRIDNLLRNAKVRALAKAEEVEEISDSTKAVVRKASTLQWLDNLEEILLANIDKINLTVDDLADAMHLSKRQFYRLIKEHVGTTPHQYLKTFRLNYARNLLEERKVETVKSAAFAVGFPNTNYFTRQFKQAFGKLPSEYLK